MVQKGQGYNTEDGRKALRDIFGMGLFDNVQVSPPAAAAALAWSVICLHCQLLPISVPKLCPAPCTHPEPEPAWTDCNQLVEFCAVCFKEKSFWFHGARRKSSRLFSHRRNDKGDRREHAFLHVKKGCNITPGQ